MTNLRVVVVGQGLIGRQRAEALFSVSREVSDRARRALSTPTRHRAAAYLTSHRCTSSTTSRSTRRSSPCRTISRRRSSARLLDRGKAVLVEKPLGLTLDEAERIRDKAAKLERPSFVGYNYRFLPTVVRAFDALNVRRARTPAQPRPDAGARRQPGFGRRMEAPPGTSRWRSDHRSGDAPHRSASLRRSQRPTSRTSGRREASGRPESKKTSSRHSSADQVLATVRVSHIRWVSTFRIELFGDDGYAVIDGRGRNLRTADPADRQALGVARIRRCEPARDRAELGLRSGNTSLVDELAAVDRAVDLRRAAGRPTFPHPATMDEATEVARECDRMYRRIAARWRCRATKPRPAACGTTR